MGAPLQPGVGLADALMEMEARERFIAPPMGWMAVWVAILVASTAVALYPFPLGCAIGENVIDGSHWGRVCDGIGVVYFGGLLGAFFPATVGAVLAQRADRLNRFVWGLLIGLALGALPYVLLGDPAGNFGGPIDAS